MRKRLEILHLVEHYPPFIGGMAEVTRQLSERLASMGHEVTVATSVHPQRKEQDPLPLNIKEFDISGNWVYGYSGNTKEYVDFLVDSNFDLVVVFAAQQWTCDLLLENIDRIQGKKVFVPTGFSGLRDSAFNMYFEKMKTWLTKFDHTVFLSHEYQDYQFAKFYVEGKSSLIPNGADEREFNSSQPLNIKEKLSIPEDANVLVHVGSFTGIKGQYEAIHILGKSGLDNTYLVLNGNPMDINDSLRGKARRYLDKTYLYPELRKIVSKLHCGNRILFTHLKREELVSLLKESDLMLFPSRVECSPLVLFEAAAASLPFFASEAGNSAEITKWLDGGWIIPTQIRRKGQVIVDIDKAATKLAELMKSPQQLAETGKKLRYSWQANYTWD